MRTAVIDLGTNTCNLLIAEVKESSYKILHQSKELVKLGDDKIKTNEISSEGACRILDALEKHKSIIGEYGAEKVKVIATSAIRSAINKIELLETIGNETGWTVKVVSGEKEADLIFKGVLLAINYFTDPAVILDIGGGSNELILAGGNNWLWKESRPTGIGRVINRFRISDPIREDEMKSLQEFFSKEHNHGFQECAKLQVKTLIGCSGAFDTIADIIDNVNPGEKQRITQKISLTDFYSVYNRLLKSTRNERIKMKGMDMVRVDLIVPAVIFIELLISKTGITNIIQTDFALREGVLFEIIEKKRIIKGATKNRRLKKSS